MKRICRAGVRILIFCSTVYFSLYSGYLLYFLFDGASSDIVASGEETKYKEISSHQTRLDDFTKSLIR